MAETIIGSDIAIDGEITGEEPLTVHGTVRGNIRVRDAVTIARSAQVEADIESESVEVSGYVQGNVGASDKIDLKSGGRLVGDCRAPRVLIADGASFRGNVNMQGQQ